MGRVSSAAGESKAGANSSSRVPSGSTAPITQAGYKFLGNSAEEVPQQVLPNQGSNNNASSSKFGPSPGNNQLLPSLTGFRAVFSACLELPASTILSSFFINLLGLALPLVVLQVYDRIIPNNALETLSFLMVGLALIVALETAMKIARAYVMGWSALHTSYKTEVEATRRILHSPLSTLDKDPSSVWMDRLDALSELNSFYGGPARLILLDLPFLMIFLIIMVLVGGLMIAVPVVMISGFAIIAIVRGGEVQAILQERSERDGRRYDFITECLVGIETIKCMAMESQMVRRFERLQQGTADIGYRAILHGDSMQSLGNLFANITMIAMVTVGAVAVMMGYLSIGALACCTLLSGRLIQPVLRSIGIWNEMQNIAVLHESAGQIFALTKIEQNELPGFSDVKGAIKIQNLSCRHPVTEKTILNGLSLEVSAGEIVGIRGNFDGGQTMLAQAIRGEIIPDQGSVYIDGISVAGQKAPSVTNSVCYLPDRPIIFRGTILENITMYREGEAIEAARISARLIGLENSVQQLPEGFDTPIGDGVTDSLSSGLMQRITIARAIARRPRVLILDEANRSLDFQSEAQLREGLEQLRGEMTILVICNRPSLLTIADRVFELRGGRLRRTASDEVSPRTPREQSA